MQLVNDKTKHLKQVCSLGVISDVSCSLSGTQTVHASSTLQLKWPECGDLENIRWSSWTPNALAVEQAYQKFRNCIKGRPCNVKTIEWGPKFLPTFLAECKFENFTVRKPSVMSGVPYFAVSTSVLPSKDQLQFVHTGAYSSRKSTAEFEALPFAKGQ